MSSEARTGAIATAIKNAIVQGRKMLVLTERSEHLDAIRAALGGKVSPMDTLALAMPVSWKGTLQQYAGRLHREHTTKTHLRILDFIDTGHPALLRMWDKRQRGYRAMGYRITVDGASDLSMPTP